MGQTTVNEILALLRVAWCGTGVAKDGRFATIATVWIADATIGLAGLVLFWRLLRNSYQVALIPYPRSPAGRGETDTDHWNLG
ncbi:MAG TPA: hypothetical protein VKD72_16290 [Gemmataceae bacterium]|nr:hypothetical protein [Gemmataceae bacterium]